MGLDFASGVSGGLTGAATGSIFGPVGTGVGAVAGLVGGLFNSKKKKKPKKLSTLDPQQQALYNDYIASIRGEGSMSDAFNFDTEGYNKVFDETIGRPAYRNFQENVIPNITGQYRSGNLMNSSYSGEALSRAGRNVQESLDAQRSANIFQGQQQANQNKIQATQNALGTSTFAYEKPGPQTPSGIDQILNTLAPHAGEWFADYLKSQRKSTAPSTPVAA